MIKIIYLDNAATTFQKPGCVKKAVINAFDNFASPGRGGYAPSIKASEAVYSARESLATLFNVKNPENIIFTCNATTAINTAIKGLITPFDSFTISSMEHNAVARPSERLKAQGSKLSYAEGNSFGYVTLDSVKKVLYNNTKLLCLIHCSNVCGSINNIDEIGQEAKKRGIIFMVDASQSAGCIDIDVEKSHIDILAFPGHKGLFGPQGSGGLYIREGLILSPLTEGGTGSLSESLIQPDFTPDRYESGTLNVPAIAGLDAGVKFILKHGVKSIGEYERYLSKILAEDLSVIKNVNISGGISSPDRGGVISIVPPCDPVVLADHLFKKYKICVRAGLHCAPLAHRTLGTETTGTVRFSPGIFNSKNDIKFTAHAVSQSIKELK